MLGGNKSLAIIDLRPNIYKVGIWKELEKSGDIDSHVYFLNDDGVFKDYFDKDSSIKRKSDTWLLENFNFSFPIDISPFKKKRSLRFLNPRVIINILKRKHSSILIHGYDNPTYLMSLLSAKIRGVKVIFRGEAIVRSKPSGGGIKSIVKRVYVSSFLKLCDSVMYSCSGNKNYFLSYGVKENVLIPIKCAVDNDFYRERKLEVDVNKVKESLKISPEKKVILFLARFTKRKRGTDLIEAVSRIGNDNIVLLFVGDGPERKNLEDMCENHNISNRFVGFKEQLEIPEYYAISDLTAIISEYDPSPKVLNEAMNFNLPAIVSKDVGTAEDLIIEGRNGYIIETGDVQTLAKKIELLVNDDDRLSSMGNESYKIVSTFNFKDNVCNIIKAMRG